MISGGQLADYYVSQDFAEVMRKLDASPRRISPSTFDLILPKPQIRTWDWICDNIYTHDGAAWNSVDFSYGEGICDEWDNPRRKTIVMQFAARAGKTTLAMAMSICGHVHDPGEAMFGSADRGLLTQQIKRYYQMLERCRATRKLIPKRHDRLQTEMEIGQTVVWGSWAGSVATLSDKGPIRQHASELDKWVWDKSKDQKRVEDDPENLWDERGIENPNRRSIKESTPTIEKQSRIHKNLLKSTNCRLYVPCPKCNRHFQMIDGRNRPGEGGIKWDGGREATPEQAKATARYLCPHCNQEWGDEYKQQIIQRNVWVPEGCYVDRRGRVKGTPKNDGEIAGFQLARWYASTFTFGKIAAKIVECLHSGDWKGYDNSWRGSVHKPRTARDDWEEVGQRLALPYEYGKCPLGAAFVAIGIDVQVDYFVFTVMAFGRHAPGWVIDYGVCDTWDDIRKLCTYGYPHADGGDPLKSCIAVVDARDGNRTYEVVAQCRKLHAAGVLVLPCMNEKTASGKAFRRVEPSDQDNPRALKEINSRRRNVFCQLMINHDYYETWIHNAIYNLKPGDDHSLAIPNECADDQNLIEQLICVQPPNSADRSAHIMTGFQPVLAGVPKDLRDAARMARCGGDVHTGGDWARVRRRSNSQTQARIAPSRPVPDRQQAV